MLTGGDSTVFNVCIGILCCLVAFLIFYFIYEIPRWNQHENYLPIMEERVLQKKKVVSLMFHMFHYVPLHTALRVPMSSV